MVFQLQIILSTGEFLWLLQHQKKNCMLQHDTISSNQRPLLPWLVPMMTRQHAHNAMTELESGLESLSVSIKLTSQSIFLSQNYHLFHFNPLHQIILLITFPSNTFSHPTSWVIHQTKCYFLHLHLALSSSGYLNIMFLCFP